MKLTATDLVRLRSPLLILAAVALGGGGLVFYTHHLAKQAEKRLGLEEAALREAGLKLHQSGEEKERILAHRSEYAALQGRGVVGEEQRINWVDALRAASLDLKMFGVNYQLEPQQPFTAPWLTEASRYRVFQSTMKIHMGLLHEEDLLRFLSKVAEQRTGMFIVRGCKLVRQSGDQADALRVRPNLEADCTLAWLTMREAEGARP